MTKDVLSQLKHSQKRCLSQHFHRPDVDMTYLATRWSWCCPISPFRRLLPGGKKNCDLILRVEEGLLGEVGSILVDFFADMVIPNGSLPASSVVMMGSLPNLDTRGLSSYTEDLVHCLSSVGARAGPGTEVVL
jgi:hypothetical protein